MAIIESEEYRDEPEEWHTEADAEWAKLPPHERLIDRVRDYPRRSLMRFAVEAGIEYDDMIRQMTEMCTGKRESKFDQRLSQDWRSENWRDFELVYGHKRPAHISLNWFSCAC